MTRKLTAMAATAAFALMAAQAHAQQAPAAPAAAAQPTPAVIPGVCVLNRPAVVSSSAVGKYATQQISQIRTDAATELNGMRTKLNDDQQKFEAEAKPFEDQVNALSQEQRVAQRATLEPQIKAFGDRANALAQREQQLEQLVQVRSQEIELTLRKAQNTIDENMMQPMQDVFGARNCSILFDTSAVPMVATSMDISRDVLAKLDAKITQFPIQRESLAAAQAAAQAAQQGGARPAAPATRPATTPARPATPAPARRR